MNKIKEKVLKGKGIKIGRKDVILKKEFADIERSMIKAIKSTDCFVQYDLLGLFVLTGFVKDKIKEERKKTIAKVRKEVEDLRNKQIKRYVQLPSGKLRRIVKVYVDELKLLLNKIGGKK